LRLDLGFFVLVGLTGFLITLGALVRAHDAGLACPDWPLCFGDVIPEMNLEVAFEWTHRVVAGAISLLFVGLGIAVLRDPATPSGPRRGLFIAGVLLAVQILLGALTVWLRVAPWTVTAHLIVGNGFCAALLSIGCALRDDVRGRPARTEPSPRVRTLVIAAAAMLFGQLWIGGLVSSSYAGLSCPEWPTCNGGLWFPSLHGNVGRHLLHRMNGYALLGVVGLAAAAARGDRRLQRLTALLFALSLVQIAIGVANVMLGIPKEITGLHSAVAAGLVLTMTLAVRDLYTRTAIER
jgi:cytochrome c oxidase assembly protein subunit 15